MATVNITQFVTEVDSDGVEFVVIEFHLTSANGENYTYRIPASWSPEDAQRTLDSFIADIDVPILTPEVAAGDHSWVAELA